MMRKLLPIIVFLGSTHIFGQNLIVNGSAEANPSTSGWTIVSAGSNCYTGSNWRITGNQNGFPAAQAGSRFFFSGCGGTDGLIYQDISVIANAVAIDLGLVRYIFTGYTQSYPQSPPDGARMRVEYRSVTSAVLATYDTGTTTNQGIWRQYLDNRVAPVGTRSIRIILSSEANNGTSVDGYFDNLSLTMTSTLPIELINFSAALTSQNQVNLNWETATETNNDFFTIEKSKDGKTWVYVNKLKGAGNSINKISYTDSDRHPFSGTSYYRLKQTDYDGKYTYSKTVAVISGVLANNSIEIYPNPASYQITINGESQDLENIRVFSASGIEVTQLLTVIEKSTYNLVLSLSNISSGVYYIQSNSNSKKLIKE